MIIKSIAESVAVKYLFNQKILNDRLIFYNEVKMKRQAFLSQFSEPQAVLFLLGWLRLLTTSLLIIFYLLNEIVGIESIQQLLNWPWILTFAAVNFSISFLTLRIKSFEIKNNHIGLILLIDILLWYGMIAASGGSINPAISYLLVLLSVAALSLEIKQSAVLALITVVLYAVLMKIQPQAHHGHMLNWHLWGMWGLFLMNATIMLVVITLLSNAIRDKDRAIAAYREETVRNEQLISLGTLAANIAHELSTPLSTIAILVDEIKHEDSVIIQQQLERCKQALNRLKSTSLTFDEKRLISSKDLIRQFTHELLLLKPLANINWEDDAKIELWTTPLFEQALLALLNNAIEAATEKVSVLMTTDEICIIIEIRHDGNKVSEDLLKALGQKMVTSDKNSLGIGYYLANASINRLGGRLQISNQPHCVLTRITFPKEKLLV